jgi:hypothetical protein
MATEATAVTTLLVVEDNIVAREGLAVLLCREGPKRAWTCIS